MNLQPPPHLEQFTEIRLMLSFGADICTKFVHFGAFLAFEVLFASIWRYNLK